MSKYQKDEALLLEYGLYTKFNPVVGPFLHEKIGLSPNMITVLSIITGLLSVYSLHTSHYTRSAVLLMVSQTFDGVDGYVARKYNMQSKFGDRLDHYSDYVVHSLIVFLILKKLFKKSKFLTGIIFTCTLFITIMLKKRHNCVMKTQKECKDPTKRHLILKNTRMLSYYEIVLCLSILIFSFNYYK